MSTIQAKPDGSGTVPMSQDNPRLHHVTPGSIISTYVDGELVQTEPLTATDCFLVNNHIFKDVQPEFITETMVRLRGNNGNYITVNRVRTNRVFTR